MNVQKTGLITLIKSALDNKSYELPNGFSLEGVIDVACEHQIAPIVYYGAINCGQDKTSDVMQRLFEKALPFVILDEQQKTALDELVSCFEVKGIEYLPLKGSVLKSMYPKTEMRTMGDIDILIKTEQYEAAKKNMEASGYIEKVESDHEFIWVKDTVCIELHKRLIPSYIEDYYAYLGDGWDFAEKCKCCSKYCLKSEMEFVYLFTHFAKHYRDGGIGIKHLLDLWVYKNAKPQLDWGYIKTELKKLRLHEFFENVQKTLDVWFVGEDETFETKLISDTIFGSGAYGDAETAEVSKVLRETAKGRSVAGTKLSRLMESLFLPYDKMREKYKLLNSFPVLLPIMWLVRLFNVMMFKREKMVHYIEKQKLITDNAVCERKEKLNAVGLDFYSEEDIL